MIEKPKWIEPFVVALNHRAEDTARCRFCGKNDMTIHENMVTSAALEGKNINLGTIIPMAMLVCNNCSNTQFFNLLMLGVLDTEGNVKS